LVFPLAALVIAGMPASALAAGAASCALGIVTYTSVFVALGLRMRRALAWGLAYILIWEGAVANAGAGLARLAIRLSTRSIAHRGFPGETIRYPIATGTATVVLLAVTAVSALLGIRWITRAEVS
jgi:ABC-2 type transport system permease protein